MYVFIITLILYFDVHFKSLSSILGKNLLLPMRQWLRRHNQRLLPVIGKFDHPVSVAAICLHHNSVPDLGTATADSTE
jgi:hypothetical protein